MKHTKKMVMVPESEYAALLSLLKAGGMDPLSAEKVQTDAKIQQTLNDPNIGEDLRAKRYGWLYKKRRQLKNVIENRPQKVVIEKTSTSNGGPPYIATGSSAQTTAKLDPTPTKQQPLATDYETAADVITPVKSSGGKKQTKRTPKTRMNTTNVGTPLKAVVSDQFLGELQDYVDKNLDKFRIHPDGKFESNVAGRKIKESNYRDVLNFMTGKRGSPSKGYKFLYERLARDEVVKELMARSRQSTSSSSARTSGESSSYTSSSSNGYSSSGEGQKGRGASKKRKKRVHVLVKQQPSPINIKSVEGVKKRVNFVPKIWEKI